MRTRSGPQSQVPIYTGGTSTVLTVRDSLQSSGLRARLPRCAAARRGPLKRGGPAQPRRLLAHAFAYLAWFWRMYSMKARFMRRGGEEKRKGSSSRTSSRVRAPKGERPNRCSEPRGCRPERTPKPNEPRVHRTSSRTSSPVRRRTRRADLRRPRAGLPLPLHRRAPGSKFSAV